MLNLFRLLTFATLAAALLVALTGWAPGSPPRETVPTSVRDNPSTWRPVYVGTTGWHPIPTSSGGFNAGK